MAVCLSAGFRAECTHGKLYIQIPQHTAKKVYKENRIIPPKNGIFKSEKIRYGKVRFRLQTSH